MTETNSSLVRAFEHAAARVRTRGDDIVAELAWLGVEAAELGARELATAIADELTALAVEPADILAVALLHATLGRHDAVDSLCARIPADESDEGLLGTLARVRETIGDNDGADRAAVQLDPERLFGRWLAKIAARRGDDTRATQLAAAVDRDDPFAWTMLALTMAATRPPTDAWARGLVDEAWARILAFEPELRASCAVQAATVLGEAGWRAFAADAAAYAFEAYADESSCDPNIAWAEQLAWACRLGGDVEAASSVVARYEARYFQHASPSQNASLALLWALAGNAEEADHYCQVAVRRADEQGVAPPHRRLAQVRAHIDGDEDVALAHAAAMDEHDPAIESFREVARIFHRRACIESSK